ncbi:MAG: serine/threonine protein kinase [Cyanobacteria bacterium REEB67]|nr:serine/threonine protein kinase [Cyanobacteria bacterium REEB67]
MQCIEVSGPEADSLDTGNVIRGEDSGSTDFAAGTLVGGHYKIKAVLGRGGMGVVYRVEHTQFGRDFALKMLAVEQTSEDTWRRFQLEGKALAKLDHRNIVKIYDMGVHAGYYPYYVMDLLEGPSLADYLAKNGPLDLTQAAAIFGQIGNGLSFAHRAGLIHRDIKPSNIVLIGLPGRLLIKIVDFGLVKLVGAAGGAVQSQTATGEVFGSPLYMSPEQCMGEKVDARSDIYSLGCTLFEALTGRPPFRGENAMATVMMHQSKAPPKLAEAAHERRSPDLYGRKSPSPALFSPELELLVATMLSKKPADRQQTVDVFLHGLARLTAGKKLRPEAVFNDTALFQVDAKSVDKKAEVLPFILLGTVVFLLSGVACLAYLYFAHSNTPVAKRQESAVHGMRDDDPQLAEAKLAFNHSAEISNGVHTVNGIALREFNFPNLPLGTIDWTGHNTAAPEAKNHISIPAQCKVKLTIKPPLGRLTLHYPKILASIGAEDINELFLDAPDATEEIQGTGRNVSISEVQPEFFQYIESWRALHTLSIHNFKISDATIAAMDNLHPINRVFFLSTFCSGEAFSHLKWLDQIQTLNLKAMGDVNPVLAKLSGSRSLIQLYIDKTDPSPAALAALANCQKLFAIEANDCNIDDQKLRAICRIKSLTSLNVSKGVFSDAALHDIANLKALRKLAIKSCPVDAAAVAALQKQLPDLQIFEK